MAKYIKVFQSNLNFIQINDYKEGEDIFIYKLENFELFDTVKYEKFIIGFCELILEHSRKNIFDKNLFANIIHMEYGILRTYVFEQNNIRFLHKEKQYDFNDFEAILDMEGLDFSDYGLFVFSYLLQQYCIRSITSVESIKQYVLNKNLLQLNE